MSSARSRSGGIVIVMTLRRYERSSRNLPAAIIPRRSRFVAAITRTSTLSALVPPTRRYSPASRKRSSFGCSASGSSPISSRNSVPLSATSTRPCLAAIALGERPLLVPEQLGLDQALREGGAVERDERGGAAPAVLPEGVRDQLLAGAALALDQHRRVRRRHLADQREDLPQLPAPADELDRGLLADEFLLEQPVLDAELAVLVGAVDEDHQLVELVGLGQVVEGPVLHRLDGRLHGGLAGEHDDRRRRGVLPQLLHRREAVHARHDDVEQDHVEGPLAQQPERLPAVGGHLDGEALAAELALEQPAERLLVVDDQDLDHGAAAAGSVITKAVPAPGALSTSIEPPCSSTMR